jgi:hypothetical protein
MREGSSKKDKEGSKETRKGGCRLNKKRERREK